MDLFLLAAIDGAKLGLAEGGIPIGSVLVCDGKIIGRGRRCFTKLRALSLAKTKLFKGRKITSARKA
jgi:tRNA(Arg) A34 adenosine deaminase TadA